MIENNELNVNAADKDRRIKVYISGSITGTEDYMERFEEAEQKLSNGGQRFVINPAKICSQLPADTSHQEYMSVCMPLLQICDAVFLLPGWRDSVGSMEEVAYANAIGKMLIAPTQEPVEDGTKEGDR